jgi:hypothetical protein
MANEVVTVLPSGDKVLEPIGTTTLKVLFALRQTGRHRMHDRNLGKPMVLLKTSRRRKFIPTAVCLTSYPGEAEDLMHMPLRGTGRAGSGRESPGSGWQGLSLGPDCRSSPLHG